MTLPQKGHNIISLTKKTHPFGRIACKILKSSKQYQNGSVGIVDHQSIIIMSFKIEIATTVFYGKARNLSNTSTDTISRMGPFFPGHVRKFYFSSNSMCFFEITNYLKQRTHKPRAYTNLAFSRKSNGTEEHRRLEQQCFRAGSDKVLACHPKDKRIFCEKKKNEKLLENI